MFIILSISTSQDHITCKSPLLKCCHIIILVIVFLSGHGKHLSFYLHLITTIEHVLLDMLPPTVLSSNPQELSFWSNTSATPTKQTRPQTSINVEQSKNMMLMKCLAFQLKRLCCTLKGISMSSIHWLSQGSITRESYCAVSKINKELQHWCVLFDVVIFSFFYPLFQFFI